MKLINYRGLNCYLACVVSVASALGINYENAFAALWSETEFIYDEKYSLYSSGRIIPKLETLGFKLEVSRFASENEAIKGFSLISEGELFIIGADTFYTPWSLMYGYFHEPHFIFARKETAELISCFDPTFDIQMLNIAHGEVISHSFEFSRIRGIKPSAAHFSLNSEAEEVLRVHPEIKKRIGAEILRCKEQKNNKPLIKLITAMINNRYLFQHFIRSYPLADNFGWDFFDRKFMSDWEAVKNGLYKAYILKDNRAVVDETHKLFEQLIDGEISMAEEIIKVGRAL